MYITKAATAATLRRLAALAPGSTVVMTFMVPLELLDEADRPGLEAAAAGCSGRRDAMGQLLRTGRIVELARDAGFMNVRYVPTAELAERYLTGRTDRLRAAGGEGILLART